MNKTNSSRYIIKDREQSPVAEAIRAMVACLQAERADTGMQSIMFTGAATSEGASLVALNAAVSLAYYGHKVILADCDLRNPVLHEFFSLENKGISNILQDNLPWLGFLQDTGIDNLQLVAAGPAKSRPVEILSSTQLRAVIAELKQAADYVIINSTPVVFRDKKVWSDACILAAKVDGVVIVLDSQAVKVQVARKVLNLLTGAKANIIGTVLDNVDPDNDLTYNALNA